MHNSFAASLLVGVLLACGASEDAPEVAPASAEIGDEERELLEALGYVYFAQEDAGDEDGVVRLDRSRAQDGYSLYSIRYRCRAELIDLDGEVIAFWEQQPCRFWSTAELLPDGGLLVTGLDPTGDARREPLDAMYLMRLDRRGNVVWKRAIAAHHDAALTPDGDILTLVGRYRELPSLYPQAQAKDEILTRLTPDGELIDELSTHDVVAAAPGMKIRRVPAREVDGEARAELYHSNSVEWIDPLMVKGALEGVLEGEDSLYGPGHVLTCLRNQNTIAIIDWEERKLVWHWGRGILQLPHHPTLLDNGNILVFDNGVARKQSRVIEVDPRTRRIVWQYRGNEAEPFYSENRGSNQRLANGNTLIADSDSGRAFEVTPDGEIVWEFLTPYRDDEGRRATIERIQRYPREPLESLYSR